MPVCTRLCGKMAWFARLLLCFCRANGAQGLRHMLLLWGASVTCAACIALVAVAQRAWLPPKKVLDAVEIEGEREAQRLVQGVAFGRGDEIGRI